MTRTTWRCTVMAELKEMGLTWTWGDAQHAAKDQ